MFVIVISVGYVMFVVADIDIVIFVFTVVSDSFFIAFDIALKSGCKDSIRHNKQSK